MNPQVWTTTRLLALMFAASGLSELSGCAARSAPPSLLLERAGALKVHLVSDLRLSLPVAADFQDSEVVWDYQVRQGDPVGGATVRLTVRSLKAAMTSVTVHCTYDSETPADKPPQPAPAAGQVNHQQRFAETFAPLKGQGCTALLDRAGRVSQLTEIDPPLERIVRGPIANPDLGGYQAALLLSENHLRRYAEMAIGTLPAQAALKKQATWQTVELAETPRGGAALVKKTCRVREVQPTPAGPKQVTIAIQATALANDALPDWAANRPAGSSDMKVLALDRGSGELLYVMPPGRLLRRAEKLSLEVALNSSASANARQAHPAAKMFYVMDETCEVLEN